MAAKTELTEQEIAKMPITKHLRELRDRIGKSVIVLIITVCVAFVFTPQLIEILKMPAGDVTLQAIELVEKLEVFVKVALAGGIILAMPFLVYQLLAYVSPALTRKEKTYIYGIIPFVTVMFLAGVAFAYFIALPPALYFLLGFMPDVAETVPRLSDYINVVTRIIVAVGCIFEDADNRHVSGKDGDSYTAVARQATQAMGGAGLRRSGYRYPHLRPHQPDYHRPAADYPAGTEHPAGEVRLQKEK